MKTKTHILLSGMVGPNQMMAEDQKAKAEAIARANN